MEPDEIYYRRCSYPDCDYKEVRGSREGDFYDGKFYCRFHYLKLTITWIVANSRKAD